MENKWALGEQFETEIASEPNSAEPSPDQLLIVKIYQSTRKHLAAQEFNASPEKVSLALTVLAAAVLTTESEMTSMDFLARYVSMAMAAVKTIARGECPCPKCVGEYLEGKSHAKGRE